MIKFRCANCQQKLGVPDEYAGRRVRCSKCSEPNVVPAAEPSGQPTAQQSTPNAQRVPQDAVARAESSGGAVELDFDSVPSSGMDDFFSGLEGLEVVQEDPNFDAIRAARQEAAAKRAAAARPKKEDKAGIPGSSGRESKEWAAIADMVPGALHLPLALVSGLIAVTVTVVLWIVVARATQRPWSIFALLVAGAGASGIRVFAVNRTMLWGILGTMFAALSIVAGKVAIAKQVVIPIYEQQANEECLKDIDALLKNEKLQLAQGNSAKPYATDSDFLMCIALVSLVHEGQADPVKARAWAIQILRASNKTNIYAYLSTAGTHSNASQQVEMDAEQEAVFEKAWQRMGEWEENETAIQNTRKYFPALKRLATQCELLRTLENPQWAFQVAMIDTVGLFDIIWILLGMGSAYIMLALD